MRAKVIFRGGAQEVQGQASEDELERPGFGGRPAGGGAAGISGAVRNNLVTWRRRQLRL